MAEPPSKRRRGGNPTYNDNDRSSYRRDPAQSYDRRPYDGGRRGGGGGGRDRDRDWERDGNRGQDRHSYGQGRRDRSPPRGPRRDRNYDRDRGGDDDRYHKPASGKVSGPRGGPPPMGPRGAPRNVKGPNVGSAGIKANGVKAEADPMNIDLEDLDEDTLLARLMGFSKFSSTKNTKVPGNATAHGLRKDRQTQYRQYMNRQGGFNRPLSPS